ncbi:helix-turn-helix domain-containing protein [Streptomyces sp. ID05-04B]|uniref:helix-turn-helix domain-containing protein n=1 Tax=Streptomyces sp. ID05-04B TaxID=3028661 RepID=UPI0039F6882F
MAQGWSLETLAARSGVSKGMLVHIEQGRTNPSIGTLCRLTDALGTTLSRLVETSELPLARVVRAGEGACLWRSEQSPGRAGCDPPERRSPPNRPGTPERRGHRDRRWPAAFRRPGVRPGR